RRRVSAPPLRSRRACARSYGSPPRGKSRGWSSRVRSTSAAWGCRGGRAVRPLAHGDRAARAEAARRLEGDDPCILAAELAPARRPEGERPGHLLRRCGDRVGADETGVTRRIPDEVGPRIERQENEEHGEAAHDEEADPVQAPL